MSPNMALRDAALRGKVSPVILFSLVETGYRVGQWACGRKQAN